MPLRPLLPLAGVLLVAAPTAAQDPCSLGQFETDAEGWVAGENAGQAYRATSMANGPGVPYAGTGMLEWTLGDARTRTDEFRSVYKLFSPALDLRETPLLSLAVNTYGREDVPERGFEARVRVWSGGVVGCGRYYVGGEADVRTATVAKNAWTPLQFDLSGFEGLGAIDKVEVGVRVTTLSAPGWFGRHQIDAVEARSLSSSSAGEEPGGAVVGVPFPNPSAGRAALHVAAPAPQRVRVSVVDALGRLVAVPYDGPVGAAGHLVEVDAGALAPGVYTVLVVGDSFRAARRLTVAPR